MHNNYYYCGMKKKFSVDEVSDALSTVMLKNSGIDLSDINSEMKAIYYPSINNENLKNFENKFFDKYNEYPNYLSLLSYDLVGLIYYLSLNTELSELNKSFKKKNSFKGKIGVFDIEDNKINHRLNFYQVNDGKLKKIF